MIITCPNCHTNYQVAQKAIGSVGRKVLCANCQQSWQALPKEKASPKPKLVSSSNQKETSANDDTIFSEQDESNLDKQFSNEEEKANANLLQEQVLEESADTVIAEDDKLSNDRRADDPQTKNNKKTNQLDEGLMQKNKQALSRRKRKIVQDMPLSKIKRLVRISMMLFLIILLAGGFLGRNYLVKEIPQLAVIYKAIGINVNIIGLDFSDVRTLLIRDNNVEKLQINAKIINLTNEQIIIPSIIVSLFDESDVSLMQWNIKPTITILEAREMFDFKTQLESMPKEMSLVKLSFAR